MPPRKLISFDWAMKKILRQGANFVILEGFLTELLKFDVKIIEILESEADQESEDDKFNRVDLVAKNGNGELILIEVQYNNEIDYFHKMLYRTSKLITQYIQNGTQYIQNVKEYMEDGIIYPRNRERKYLKVKRAYCINIVYFEIGQGDDYVYCGKTEFRGINTDDILMPSEIQKRDFKIDLISEIYPEYYILRINQFNDITKNTLDEWIYFLKNEEIKTDFRAKGLSEAKEVLDVLKLNSEERAIYKRKEGSRKYKESLIYTAEKKGVEKGKKVGEKKKAIEIAKNLLLANIDIDTIIKSTGLTAKEIEKLRG